MIGQHRYKSNPKPKSKINVAVSSKNHQLIHRRLDESIDEILKSKDSVNSFERN